jgi:basic membrane protein A and related proteins
MKRILVAASAAAFGLSAIAASADDTARAGFVYVGPIGDHGWTYQHNAGRLAVEERFGDRVETSYVENVSEGPDAERVIRQMAEDGYDIVFTTSFGFMNPTARVAQRFPDTKFEHATGYTRADNLATYDARFYEGRYIIGQIAAQMSESGILGYIASYPIPEVVSGINSYMLGAQSINPDIEIRIIWVNSWYDPGREADAATALIDQGADVLAQHTDSPAALQVAEQRGVYAFGQASDMIRFAPTRQLTAIIDDWSEYYVERVQAVMDGTWESGAVWGGLDSGMVRMADYTNMPEDVAAMARETEEAIRTGAFHPFTGPIVNQAGEEIIGDGEVLTDDQIHSMDWYIQGIDDTLPN